MVDTLKNLEEAKPIEVESFNLEVTSEDSIKYLIKIASTNNKLILSTSYSKGLICKEYFSSYEISKLCENQNFSFNNINEYVLF